MGRRRRPGERVAAVVSVLTAARSWFAKSFPAPAEVRGARSATGAGATLVVGCRLPPELDQRYHAGHVEAFAPGFDAGQRFAFDH